MHYFKNIFKLIEQFVLVLGVYLKKNCLKIYFHAYTYIEYFNIITQY